MSELYYTIHPSAIGELLLVGGPKGLRYVRLVENDDADAMLAMDFPGEALVRLDGFFATAIGAIDHYLSGAGPLELPYDLQQGTPLQRAVWLELVKVPYGETISYTTLAERVGFPRAVRAVASACGANPVPLVIPCHRIVSKDGTLGGFSLGGIDIKEKLLAAEQKKSAVAA